MQHSKDSNKRYLMKMLINRSVRLIKLLKPVKTLISAILFSLITNLKILLNKMYCIFKNKIKGTKG